MHQLSAFVGDVFLSDLTGRPRSRVHAATREAALLREHRLNARASGRAGKLGRGSPRLWHRRSQCGAASEGSACQRAA